MTNPLRLRYQTIEIGNQDIHLCTLRNRQEFYDPHNIALNLGISSAMWPIFGIVWPSSIVLANYMANFDTKGKRILEVGCGMALSGLLLNSQNADITLTDFHPEVNTFLQPNIKLNNGKAISFERADWNSFTDNLGQFDLIIGSDILYEQEHSAILANFIHHHAKPECEVIIVDPNRGWKNKLSNSMKTFGFTNTQAKPTDTSYMPEPFKGTIITYKRSSADQKVICNP